MKNNTVVTAGDSNYLWGLFLLLASMRRTGMDEPVLIGTKRFDERCRRVLEQFGDVRFHSLDDARHNLTCQKAAMMLEVDNEYVTWADSDGLFSGNVSELLPPPDHAHIHVRRRKPDEMPGAFPPAYSLSEILPRWRKDVGEVLGRDLGSSPTIPDFEHFQSVSACFLSVARDREEFLQTWHAMLMRLPEGDTGVTDRSLACYHQLDESCLNAVLQNLPNAPVITDVYRMDKDEARLFVHFCGRPKPWVAWIPSALRHYESTLQVVEWAQEQKLELPSEIPPSLCRKNGELLKKIAPMTDLVYKIRRKLKI